MERIQANVNKLPLQKQKLYLYAIAIVPASANDFGGTGLPVGFFITTELAPVKSACTYRSPALRYLLTINSFCC